MMASQHSHFREHTSMRPWWRHQWKHFPRYWPFVRGIPSQRPVTRSFDVFLDLCLKKRLSKQSRRRWFETPWRSLWCNCNAILFTGTDNDLVGIVSGVTVLRGGDNRVVVFGCYPDAPGQGGAGIMRLHRTEEHGEIRPLAQGDHRLLAGSIFTNRHVVRKCSFGQDLPICLGPPKPTTTPPPVETTTLNEQQSDGTGGGNDVNSGGGNSPGGNQDGGKPSIEEKDPVADHNVDNSAVTCILSCLMYILPVLVYVL